jgi:hypothetical protein
VLTAEGAKQAAILRAEGDAKAIDTVFSAIHHGKPDQELLSYQYLQMLPQLAQGSANKVFVIPSEFTEAFSGIGKALGSRGGTDRADDSDGDSTALEAGKGPQSRGELGQGDGPGEGTHGASPPE